MAEITAAARPPSECTAAWVAVSFALAPGVTERRRNSRIAGLSLDTFPNARLSPFPADEAAVCPKTEARLRRTHEPRNQSSPSAEHASALSAEHVPGATAGRASRFLIPTIKRL